MAIAPPFLNEDDNRQIDEAYESERNRGPGGEGRWIAWGDLFANGCYLIRNGQPAAGHKFCRHALRAMGLDDGLRAKIIQGVPVNELELARRLGAHLEALDLLRSDQVQLEGKNDRKRERKASSMLV